MEEVLVTKYSNDSESGIDRMPLHDAVNEIGNMKFPHPSGQLVGAEEILRSGLQVTMQDGTYLIEGDSSA